MLIISLSACGNTSDKTNSDDLLKSPFIMEIHKTYINGAFYHSYPEKVFETDELFNLLNSASAEEPFEASRPAIRYHIEMVNGSDYTTYEIWSDGCVTMEYNFLNNSEFYLTESQYQSIVNLLDI